MSTNKQVIMPLPDDSVLFICDLQENFRSKYNFTNIDSIISTAKFVLNVCEAFNIPVIATEHAKKAFGPIATELRSNNATYFEKTSFSMCTKEVLTQLNKLARNNIIMVGIETHICVLHTVLDLLNYGYNVHLIVDGTGSSKSIDSKYAIKRMIEAGCIVTTSQSLSFQLLRDAKNKKFKEIQKYVKQNMNDIKYHQNNKSKL